MQIKFQFKLNQPCDSCEKPYDFWLIYHIQLQQQAAERNQHVQEICEDNSTIYVRKLICKTWNKQKKV